MVDGQGRLVGISVAKIKDTSIGFAGRLLDDTGVVVTPGIGYGEYGEGYVRLSITTPDDQIDEGCAILADVLRQAVA